MYERCSPAVVVYTFNPSTQNERQADLCDFKASLVYKSKVPGQALKQHRNSVSKKNILSKQLYLMAHIYHMEVVGKDMDFKK